MFKVSKNVNTFPWLSRFLGKFNHAISRYFNAGYSLNLRYLDWLMQFNVENSQEKSHRLFDSIKTNDAS